jgi:lipoprotein-anchoring transpeptidase ErfK/SrfK
MGLPGQFSSTSRAFSQLTRQRLTLIAKNAKELTRRPLLLSVALLTVAVVALGGATLAGAFSSEGVPGLLGAGTHKVVPPVAFAFSPANKAGKIRLDAHAKVLASGGNLSSVRLAGPDGVAVTGAYNQPRTGWTSIAPLAPATRYKLAVVGTNSAGVATRQVSSFTTLRPAAQLGTAIMPLDGERVGVGMPIGIFFSQPVANRAAIEKRLKVTSTPKVVGAWHWFNDKEIHYRPKDYWPSGTKVSLRVPLKGVDAGAGVWGVRDRTIGFTIGARHISVVNVNSHNMKVTSDGQTLQNFPMSAGRPKFPTTNGIHFTLEKAKTVVMDSQTVGIPRNSPDGYFETVHWNVRISTTGEFVHAAPWSVGAQGSSNVSHGCVNLSVANATWFYNFSQRGDIVQVVGSPKQNNGWALGTVDWNLPWSQWLQGSALQ